MAEREKRITEEYRRLETERREFETMRRERDDALAAMQAMREEYKTILDRSTVPAHVESPEPCPESFNFTMKEALATIPTFDGTDSSILSFTRACRRARDLIPPNAEITLTRLISTRYQNFAAVSKILSARKER
ncbi:hypothetical protein WH47_05042 [Habropoda laboriosa]|uniref:Uncharacterized protein n=1 Tax=Habropoda laboriosa TaxID=597456 RepID=A0A0L7QW09_9HYME|nr:hypothetical protein WH47_05042 [Habropoda laboriosa]